MSEAFFAGRIFVPGEQDGYKFLMWGTHSLPTDGRNGMVFSTTVAEPAEGAFLCKVPAGWLLVAAAGRYQPVRHTFLDDSPAGDENARSLQVLGVPVLTIEEGNKRLKEDGAMMLYSITSEEKQRAEATARHAAWLAEYEAKKAKKATKAAKKSAKHRMSA